MNIPKMPLVNKDKMTEADWNEYFECRKSTILKWIKSSNKLF